jgi:hypothetical protein
MNTQSSYVLPNNAKCLNFVEGFSVVKKNPGLSL